MRYNTRNNCQRLDLRYNYVIFGTNKDYYRWAYRDLENLDYAKIIWSQIDVNSKFLQSLNRLHYSDKLNKLVQIPLKNIWMPLNFINSFNDNKPICFIYFGSRKNVLSVEYIKYLRSKYPRSKHVIYFLDLVEITHKREDAIELIKNADLSYSFDVSESRKYGIEYQHELYSSFCEYLGNEEKEERDVFFLGKAKNRLEVIMSAYKQLSDLGLKCDFYLIDVEQSKRHELQGIHYIDKPMTYEENIKHVVKSKALLEVLQDGAIGSTLRCCEAICYNKVLITNNPQILNEPYYTKERIRFFESVGELKSFRLESYNAQYQAQDIEYISPLMFLSQIDKII